MVWFVVINVVLSVGYFNGFCDFLLFLFLIGEMWRNRARTTRREKKKRNNKNITSPIYSNFFSLFLFFFSLFLRREILFRLFFTGEKIKKKKIRKLRLKNSNRAYSVELMNRFVHTSVVCFFIFFCQKATKCNHIRDLWII